MIPTSILAIIIQACALGASGMGMDVGGERTLQIQKLIIESNLATQRRCQAALIKCTRNSDIESCLLDVNVK